MTLSDLKKKNFMGAIPITEQKRIHDSKIYIIDIAMKLVDFVEGAHKSNIYLNDISLSNFIVSSDGQLKFIDVETIICPSDKREIITQTFGYNDENIFKYSYRERDNRRLGYLLIDFVCSANGLLKTDPTGQQTKQVFSKFCELFKFPEIFNIVAKLENWNKNEICQDKSDILDQVNHEICDIEQFLAVTEHSILPNVQANKPTIGIKYDLLKWIENTVKRDGILKQQDAQYILNLANIVLESDSEVAYVENLLYTLIEHMRPCSHVFGNSNGYFLLNELGNFSPYLSCSGSVVYSALNILKKFPDLKLASIVKKRLEAFDINFARNISYTYGLAGIADIFLEAYEVFGSYRYLDSAISKFEVIKSFKNITGDASWIYPDSKLTSVNNDFDNGTQGILYFYNHLRNIMSVKTNFSKHREDEQ